MDPSLEAFLKLALNFLPPQAQKAIGDALVDFPVAADAYTSVKAALAKMPPKAERSFVSIMTAFGVPAEAPLYKAAHLADLVEKQIEDFKPAPSAPAA